MAQIQFLQKEDEIKKGKKGGAGFGQTAGMVLGGVAGAYAGGAGGAVKGASAGAAMGSQFGGMANKATADELIRAEQTQGVAPPTAGAVDRRLAEMQVDPSFQLKQAQAALQNMPTDVQKQYAPTIDMALAASQRAQRVGQS